VKSLASKLLLFAAAMTLSFAVIVAAGISGAYLFVQPSLPSIEDMRRIELQVPLRVYSRDGQVIAQIGEQRRLPVTFEQIPVVVRQAFIAAEDEGFFEHSGFDYRGILRSVFVNLMPGSRTQGASTITMQTARNLFLTQDRTWRRKIQEIFLTYRIEQEFSKEEILGLYLNVISFGKRTYGIAAAAEYYFGKTLDELTLAEAATLARVPQAPSRYNPIANPQAAAQRRGYVLRRMREAGFIDRDAEMQATAQVVRAKEHARPFDVEAPYVAEMARLELVNRFGNAAQSEGYRIYTTIDPQRQAAANMAIRNGLLAYDQRYGWRGPLDQLPPSAFQFEDQLESKLNDYDASGPLLPAVVLKVDEQSAEVLVRGEGTRRIEWDGMSWARRNDNGRLGAIPKRPADVLRRGDIVQVIVQSATLAQLSQLPEASAALVALSPDDGAIEALVGGFDYFDQSVGKFNRAVQARRQPGSGFKPFLYSAALDNGFTPASIINDEPFVVDEPGMEEAWRPENFGGDFQGPTRLREALVKSKNLVSIRLLEAVGIAPVIAHAERFGFDRTTLPRNLTLALGTMSASPLQVAAGYAVFANGGYRVQPYFIERIEDPAGNVVFQAAPRKVAPECDRPTQADWQESDINEAEESEATAFALLPTDCPYADTEVAPRVISAQNAWLMDDILRDVIKRGTGRRALALGRTDLAGKTGTTNDSRDTWFNGYNRQLVASVWVGFDQSKSLGEAEEGSRTAAPIWVDFMQIALKNVEEAPRTMPDGLVRVRINASNGAIASADDVDAIFETFMTDSLPESAKPNARTDQRPTTTVVEPLF
jgi:penicillin-binding protein 1A